MDRAFSLIKKGILGDKYELSIAYVSEKKSREINKRYRHKDKPTNVLSFTLSKNSGELVLCPALIKREAKKLGRAYPEWLGFLVIHGMLHLKGYRHGSIMERAEKKYGKKYNLKHDQKHLNRNRRGLGGDARRGGRNGSGRKKS